MSHNTGGWIMFGIGLCALVVGIIELPQFVSGCGGNATELRYGTFLGTGFAWSFIWWGWWAIGKKEEE